MLDKLNLNMWDIINIITSYVDWIAFFTVIHAIGSRKICNRKYFLRIILVMLFMGYVEILPLFQNLKIVMCMIVGIIFYKISYEDNIYKCIIMNLLFWLGIMIIEAISIGIVVVINQLESIQPLLSGNLYRLEAVVISKVLLLIELILFKYFRLSLEFKRKDMILIGIPVLSNIISLLLIFGYNLKQNIASRTNIILLVFITFLMVMSSIILLIIIGKIVQDDKLKLEYELINERINTNYKNYENINEIHNKVRYVYHDLKNHMVCMKSYNTREEIIAYINDLELQISDFQHFKNTGNQTLDIVLGEKIYICKKYNIEFEEYINISKLNFIKNIDICAIFSNALDNAIEACKNINENMKKRIEVKVTYINGFSILKFTNTKNNEIKFTDNRIQTTKDDKKIHGIGLASIKHIVKKYEGEVIVNYSEDEFILKIMIPIK